MVSYGPLILIRNVFDEIGVVGNLFGDQSHQYKKLQVAYTLSQMRQSESVYGFWMLWIWFKVLKYFIYTISNLWDEMQV